MYKIIFIDIDDTLLSFDGYVREAMKKGFEIFGLRTYEPWMLDVFHEENNKLWRKIEKAELTFEELQKIRWNIIFKRLDIQYDGPSFEKFFRAELDNSAIPVEGAYQMLEDLKKHFVLAVASNGPTRQQIHRLEIADMKKYFTYFFVSERVGVSKPAKAFFDFAFAEINEGREIEIKPEECLFIGDSLTSDMAGGHNAGMKTCLFKNHRDITPNANVDFVIEDLSEALNIALEK